VRLGLLGGTFDPIHLGHLLLAEQAREQMRCDAVLLVPASRPPHKPDRRITPYALRLRMLELALADVPGLRSSELERDPARPSFTADTLRRLRREEPGITHVALVMGSDSLLELSTWREPEEILRMATLAVYPRPGEGPGAQAPIPPLAELQVHLPQLRAEHLRILEGPRLRLSSTEVRQRAASGRSIRFLVPEPVRRFIEEEGLYRTPEAGHGT